MLKTDYKDDLFEGERKYKMTTDTEGKVTLKDETTYTQKGTSFGALDMNNTNTAVNRLYGEKSVTLTGAGWTSMRRQLRLKECWIRTAHLLSVRLI